MERIADLSDRIGELICKKAGLETEIKTISYGVESILVFVFGYLAILLVGLLVGVFWETLMVGVGMLVMKTIIGGAHLSGFSRCLGFSILILIGIAFGLRYYSSWFSIPLFLVLYLMSVLIIQRYAPMSGLKKFERQQIKYRRILAVLISSIVLLLLVIRPTNWLIGCWLGTFFAIINISPPGVRLVAWLEKMTKRKEEFGK